MFTRDNILILFACTCSQSLTSLPPYLSVQPAKLISYLACLLACMGIYKLMCPPIQHLAVIQLVT
jgi:hypothetical protein